MWWSWCAKRGMSSPANGGEAAVREGDPFIRLRDASAWIPFALLRNARPGMTGALSALLGGLRETFELIMRIHRAR